MSAKNKEQMPHHEYMTENNYLNQMRDLVLRMTSDLDCTVFLFGSRARSVNRRSSDIDIGFCGLSEPVFLCLRDRLLAVLEESVIPHHVDLVNMDAVPSDFKKIAMERVVIWKRSSHEN